MTIAFERKLSVLVGIPSGGGWASRYGISLTNMLTYFMATPVPGYRSQRVQPFQIRGSILPRSRGKIVQEALKKEHSHILFVDTDQTFPRDTLHRLLAWDKDVVGCNISTKELPSQPTARKYNKDRWDGDPVYTDFGQKGLEEVWRLGTGIMLIKTSVFKKLGPGCFQILWIPEIEDYQGEDWYMCKMMHENGYKIFIDHGLSDLIGHLGEFEFKHEHVGEKVLVEQKMIGER